MFFRQCNVRHYGPRLEFICVDGFGSELCSARRSRRSLVTDVGLIGTALTSEDVDVKHGSPPSLARLEFADRSMVR